jgi:hypothetical protein
VSNCPRFGVGTCRRYNDLPTLATNQDNVKLNNWAPQELNENQTTRRFEMQSGLLFRNKTNRFLIKLWRVKRNGSYTTTSDDPGGRFIITKRRNTSQSQSCVRERLW